jgi:hypothetical protein
LCAYIPVPYWTVLYGISETEPHWSASIWLSWIRIQIFIGNADPDPGTWKLNKINK